MNIFTRITSILFVLLVLASCKRTNISSDAPDKLSPTAIFERKISTINVPISIAVKELEGRINQQFSSVLYKDDDLAGDNVKVTVTRSGNIGVKTVNNKLSFTVPIHVWGLGSWEWQACSFCPKLSKSQATNFDMNISVETLLELTEDWQIKTTTTGNYNWGKTRPTLNIGPISVPLSGIIDMALKPQMNKIAAQMDKEIQNRVNIKQYVQKAWVDVQQPILLDQAMNAWLAVSPQELRITPLTAKEGTISMKVGIKSFIEVVSGSKPAPVINGVLPRLITDPNLADDFEIGLIGEISYDQATALLKQQVLNKPYTFENNKYLVIVKDLALSSNGDKLLMDMVVDGKAGKKKLGGRIYMEGIPYYDAATSSVRVKDFDYNVKTKNVLLKSASWLANVGFHKKLEEMLVFPLEGQLKDMQKAVQDNLDKSIKFGSALTLKGNLAGITPEGIYLTPNSIKAVINAKGKLTAVVDKM
jgi:hypothetical protein